MVGWARSSKQHIYVSAVGRCITGHALSILHLNAFVLLDEGVMSQGLCSYVLAHQAVGHPRVVGLCYCMFVWVLIVQPGVLPFLLFVVPPGIVQP